MAQAASAVANLKDFSDQHEGLRFIARRHFGYRKPVGDDQQAMVYTRQLDPGKLGLDATGTRGAMMHGEKLATFGLIPDVIFYGRDQRNFDGAFLTAEAIKEQTKKAVPCFENVAVTYPVYRDNKETADALAQYGDPSVHRTLAGNLKLWTEPVQVFQHRIVNSVELTIGEAFALWDLNYEAVVLLYYHYVKQIRALSDIPFEGPSVWLPIKGGGIAQGKDGMVAVFDHDLNIVEVAS